jgi:NTP pyrophosphatase (non-canonical NTP hydrolase)
MHDNTATIDDLKKVIKKFVDEREWQQYHSPKNLSMQIAAEAAELMELFLWIDSKESFDEIKKNKEAIEQEIADIAHGIICFCIQANIDLSSAIENKMALNAKKYPIEKAKGRRVKYTRL